MSLSVFIERLDQISIQKFYFMERLDRQKNTT